MIEEGAEPKLCVNWLTVELLGRVDSGDILEEKISSKTLATMVKRISDGTISGKAGKDVLDYLIENGGEVDSVIEKLGLKQVNDDSAIEKMVDEILSNNQDKVEEYKAGKEKLFGFFVGQVMKASRGSANPAKVNEILKKKLS
jgi:aspartyl-tRNA(Asn)/glutamyl-tRNA(Gln) amidotransferase subunit B